MSAPSPGPRVPGRRDVDGLYLLVLLALAAPFYLNDFANLYVDDWRWWLAGDYIAVKLLPLALIVWLVSGGRMGRGDFGLSGQAPAPFIATFGIAVLAGVFIDQNGAILGTWRAWDPLGGMPPITSALWNRVDLTLGLALVGLVEELVFRAYACSVLLRFTDSRTLVVVISSLAFGLIHWSLGSHAVLVTGIIGALFMLLYLITRSVFAIALAHFVINFVDFAGVIPGELFSLG